MRKSLALVLGLALFADQLAIAGLDSHKARYMGGTWTQFKPELQGKLILDDPKFVTFVPDKEERGASISYDKVTSLEYGQKVGRRVGLTLITGAWPLLLSKKRRHYLSIGFTDDEGKAGGVILELGKDVTRAALKTIEFRTGKKVEYETEEARKNSGN